MKRLIVIILLSWVVCAQAQSGARDLSRITIHAVVPDYEELPRESHQLLETKLSQIITENGIEDNEYGARFVLTAKVNVISKDIVAGSPARISMKLDITLILGDIVEDKVYSRKTISAIGIGVNEEKAFIAAFKNIKPNDEAISLFIQDGKQKILDFYKVHFEDIIAEARDMTSQNRYEQAILMLSTIPDINSDCFSECVELTQTIYQQMITVRGEELLRKAQNTWAKNPTKQGANEATQYLQQINHAAPCQSEVTKLLNRISEKMNEIDRREWQHDMQVYRDGVERKKREWEQHVREHNDHVETQRMFLRAARDVAMEKARNQPREINYYRVNYIKIYSW